ncbi:MAG: hypothetical protein EOO07_17005 [Chitinophagaceae bacterium]|nr:MAG: hypothetical protein EOO07_17005 [Chitinophagaceae bacterium]
MGIVIRQSIRNTAITYIGFGIGAANTLFFYPDFLGKELYGVTSFVLATANVLMPVMAFGVQNTLIKYFSQYTTDAEKNGFLTFVVLLPLLLILPISLGVFIFYDEIAGYFSTKNPEIFHYFWQIPIIALCMGYFEIFYAWAKAHYETIFGNFVREILLRALVSVALTGVFLQWYSPETFINLTLLVYFIATLSMMSYAFRIRAFSPDFRFFSKTSFR